MGHVRTNGDAVLSSQVGIVKSLVSRLDGGKLDKGVSIERGVVVGAHENQNVDHLTVTAKHVVDQPSRAVPIQTSNVEAIGIVPGFAIAFGTHCTGKSV